MARIKMSGAQRKLLGDRAIVDLKTKARGNKSFVKVILKEDLYLKLDTKKLADCKCYVPAIDKEAESVNSTYTIISQQLEEGRRNPGGSAINEFFFEDHEDNNYWKPLKNLRDRKISIKRISIEEIPSFLTEHEELLSEIVRNNITKDDIIAIAYRKDQINIFGQLLTDPSFFEEYRNSLVLRGDEAVWQYFFEKNPWIFGYGLSYIFCSPLTDEKLEQVVQGFSFFQHGKRVDALMKTGGIISSLYFVEIKTHKTRLLMSSSYRADCWSPSEDLAGGLSQIQKTVQKAVNNIRSKVELINKDGDPTGEVAYLYRPRSALVVGCLDEFRTSHGVNEEKYSSFELFRQSIVDTEIITFDELYERAKFIIQRSEK